MKNFNGLRYLFSTTTEKANLLKQAAKKCGVRVEFREPQGGYVGAWSEKSTDHFELWQEYEKLKQGENES